MVSSPIETKTFAKGLETKTKPFGKVLESKTKMASSSRSGRRYKRFLWDPSENMVK